MPIRPAHAAAPGRDDPGFCTGAEVGSEGEEEKRRSEEGEEEQEEEEGEEEEEEGLLPGPSG